MNEEEAKVYFKNYIKVKKEVIKERQKEGLNADSKYTQQLEEMVEAFETVLNLLEKKDKRISDLEYALIDMVMQFADRPKIKDCHYALSTMGLSALETAFAELDFDDPMPVAEAEKKYKVLVDKYFEKKVEG